MLEELRQYAKVEVNVSLVKHNTYRIGGTTKYLVLPN